MSKLFVKIKFESHEYTATVTRVGQLEQFLSKKKEKFRLGSVEGPTWKFPNFIDELNRISRFGHCLNRSATI